MAKFWKGLPPKPSKNQIKQEKSYLLTFTVNNLFCECTNIQV